MSNYEYIDGARFPIKAWIKGVPLETEAIEQLRNTANLPFIHRAVACMPDAHFGLGATIGSVIPTKNAIIPAACGVDIGCGMLAVKLEGLKEHQLPDNLKNVRHNIERSVPVGFNTHRSEQEPSDIDLPGMIDMMDKFISEKHPKIFRKRKKRFAPTAARQIGTLGGGNHFIELCRSREGDIWIMLHSGSRGIGNEIGQYFIELAKKDMEKWFINLPDKNLSYFPEGTEHFDDYWYALKWAQNFAALNRKHMLDLIITALERDRNFPDFVVSDEKIISCHHNYVEREHHFGENVLVTRKGAVRAREGDMGIIPGSMGDRSYIVRGRGNPDSFHSCSHGAGRRMSRKRARETISLDEHIERTEGVECKKDRSVLDESPGAYKSIEAVMGAQEDLVEVVHELRQVVCVKG